VEGLGLGLRGRVWGEEVVRRMVGGGWVGEGVLDYVVMFLQRILYLKVKNRDRLTDQLQLKIGSSLCLFYQQKLFGW
jgi:hypothetical protein